MGNLPMDDLIGARDVCAQPYVGATSCEQRGLTPLDSSGEWVHTCGLFVTRTG